MVENATPFRTLGTMLDCSRNAVPNMASLRRWIDLTSRLGYNALMLYTEDTYEVDDNPFFGYMRGRFSQDELREADRYARGRGMTLIPCIQVLAHLPQIKRWADYGPHFDTADILLVGDEQVYALIEKMFESIAACFSCRVIHIGMDEAHMLGRGRCFDRRGSCDRTALMLEHLRRVCAIGEKYGFRFLMWSDMFFRLAAGGSYYASDVTFSDEVRRLVPENVDLVYWDYYHTRRQDYDGMIEAHERLHPGTWFAGGLWSWTGFTPHNAFSIDATRAALESCRSHGVRDVFFTLWGDDGAECSRFALLPALFCAAELARGNADEEEIRRKFEAFAGVSFDGFMELDLPGTLNAQEGATCNQEKYLLYNDCFMGQLDGNVPDGCGAQYAACAERLEALQAQPEWGILFRTCAALCRVLEIKAELGIRTHRLYQAGDMEGLRVLTGDYRELERRLERFHAAFREQWFAENRPHGFDVQDIRLGGLMQRVKSCRERLQALCDGRIHRIEELEERQLDYFAGRGCGPSPTINNWSEIVSANVVVF